MPSRPRNTYVKGDHLVTTDSGDVELASQTATEKYGRRAGMLVHKDDLDEPGRFDIKQRYRTEKPVRPITGEPEKIWRVYDQDGNAVSGGPADV